MNRLRDSWWRRTVRQLESPFAAVDRAPSSNQPPVLVRTQTVGKEIEVVPLHAAGPQKGRRKSTAVHSLTSFRPSIASLTFLGYSSIRCGPIRSISLRWILPISSKRQTRMSMMCNLTVLELSLAYVPTHCWFNCQICVRITQILAAIRFSCLAAIA